MYEVSDFRKGLKILIEGQPFEVIDFQHVKPGKGNQFTRSRLRNVITGANLERTFKSGEKFEVPDVSHRNMNFLYQDANGYNFMDQKNYEQLTIPGAELGEATNFLTDNMEVVLQFFNGKPIGCDLPKAVNLKVVRTDPGLKGNTVSGGNKPATLETGYVVQVPLHINEGDVLRIDTRSGEYIERAKT
jgi:elongation factor P